MEDRPVFELLHQPHVIFVIPVYNAASTLGRCVKSALQQESIASHVIVVDHGSQDGSLEIVQQLSTSDERIQVISLSRTPRDRRTPARPLNVGLRAALQQDGPDTQSWVFRLDADDVLVSDDVVSTQLAAGGYRALILAPLVFFDDQKQSAYVYGPWPSRRTLQALRRRGAYSVAHHATAMRCDMLNRVADQIHFLLDEELDYGEDLSLTCLLLRSITDSDFAFVDSPYCYKALGPETATGTISIRNAWNSHVRLLRRNPELRVREVLRGFAELALARVTGESASRRSLRYLAGENGFYREYDFRKVAQRLRALGLAFAHGHRDQPT